MQAKNDITGWTPDQLYKKYVTKSATIRALDQKGLTRSQIAKKLGIRYQHVRNVLITPLKREDNSIL